MSLIPVKVEFLKTDDKVSCWDLIAQVIDKSPYYKIYWAESNNDASLPKSDFILNNRVNGLWQRIEKKDRLFGLISLKGAKTITQFLVFVAKEETDFLVEVKDMGWDKSFDWVDLTPVKLPSSTPDSSSLPSPLPSPSIPSPSPSPSSLEGSDTPIFSLSKESSQIKVLFEKMVSDPDVTLIR